MDYFWWDWMGIRHPSCFFLTSQWLLSQSVMVSSCTGSGDWEWVTLYCVSSPSSMISSSCCWWDIAHCLGFGLYVRCHRDSGLSSLNMTQLSSSDCLGWDIISLPMSLIFISSSQAIWMIPWTSCLSAQRLWRPGWNRTGFSSAKAGPNDFGNPVPGILHLLSWVGWHCLRLIQCAIWWSLRCAALI